MAGVPLRHIRYCCICGKACEREYLYKTGECITCHSIFYDHTMTRHRSPCGIRKVQHGINKGQYVKVKEV